MRTSAQNDSEGQDVQAAESQWCVVGNIAATPHTGVDGQLHEIGTKHFSVGTKVYCMPAQWGDGYEKIVVIGKHRGSRRYVRMVIPSRRVAGWRAKVVYSPAVLELICEMGEEQGRTGWKSKAEVEAFVSSIERWRF